MQLFSVLQIIHLKRFQFVNGRWIKSQKIVKFPRESFDPSAFLVPRDPALCQRKPLTPQGDDLSEARIPAGEVKKADAQSSAGEDAVLLSKSPSSLSANIASSPKGEEPKPHSGVGGLPGTPLGCMFPSIFHSRATTWLYQDPSGLRPIYIWAVWLLARDIASLNVSSHS